MLKVKVCLHCGMRVDAAYNDNCPQCEQEMTKLSSVLINSEDESLVVRTETIKGREVKVLFRNQIVEGQTEMSIVPDDELGHTMPKDHEFLGEKDYISMKTMIKYILSKNKNYPNFSLSRYRQNGKKIILNIGDSSTTGWDSNVVTENRERIERGEKLLPAFFRYKTYSDYLREKIGENYIVINAGVPAHTSLQGKLRLKKIINELKKIHIQIDYVTAYYGNNDSIWEYNREDKDWVTPSILRNIKRKFSNREESIITRVTPADYKRNMEEIVSNCRKWKIVPILIEPVTPIYWEPGTRVIGEKISRKDGVGAELVYELLDSALSIWNSARYQDYSELKQIVLQEAREKDFIVPRIKRSHLNKLTEISIEKHIKLIQIEKRLDRSRDDIKYFIDYCHPIGETNKIIAESIKNTIDHFEVSKQKMEECKTSRSNYRVSGKAAGSLPLFSRGCDKNNDRSKDIYPLW